MQVNEQNLINDLSAMVRIPSVNTFGNADPKRPAEEEMAQFFETRMKEIGLDVSSAHVADGRRNVWAASKGQVMGRLSCLQATWIRSVYSDMKTRLSQQFWTGACTDAARVT